MFGEYPAPTGVVRGGRASARRAGRSGRVREDDAWWPAAVPRRQARPRRPQQRCRADRRRRPRCRHGGRLLRHPPDAGADRLHRRATRTPTWSACRSSAARTSRWCQAIVLEPLRSEGVDAPVVVGGIIPEAGPGDGCWPPASQCVYTPKDYELAKIMRRHRRAGRRAPRRLTRARPGDSGRDPAGGGVISRPGRGRSGSHSCRVPVAAIVVSGATRAYLGQTVAPDRSPHRPTARAPDRVSKLVISAYRGLVAVVHDHVPQPLRVDHEARAAGAAARASRCSGRAGRRDRCPSAACSCRGCR